MTQSTMTGGASPQEPSRFKTIFHVILEGGTNLVRVLYRYDDENALGVWALEIEGKVFSLMPDGSVKDSLDCS